MKKNDAIKQFIMEVLSEDDVVIEPSYSKKNSIKNSLDYIDSLSLQIMELTRWARTNWSKFDEEELDLMGNKLEKFTQTMQGMIKL